MKSWFAYIIRCSDGTLYTGVTNDLAERLKKHDAGKASRYTRGRGPVVLSHFEKFGSMGEALRREAEIKRLSREKKQELINAHVK